MTLLRDFRRMSKFYLHFQVLFADVAKVRAELPDGSRSWNFLYRWTWQNVKFSLNTHVVTHNYASWTDVVAYFVVSVFHEVDFVGDIEAGFIRDVRI